MYLVDSEDRWIIYVFKSKLHLLYLVSDCLSIDVVLAHTTY